MRQFLPDVTIELRGPGGASKRRLRNDYGAIRLLRGFYPDDKVLSEAPVFEAIPRLLFAMTSHEREEGETPESFETLCGPANQEYLLRKIAEANGLGRDDEEPDPTTAPNGSVKSSRIGKRSKRSPKSASESRPIASIQ